MSSVETDLDYRHLCPIITFKPISSLKWHAAIVCQKLLACFSCFDNFPSKLLISSHPERNPFIMVRAQREA